MKAYRQIALVIPAVLALSACAAEEQAGGTISADAEAEASAPAAEMAVADDSSAATPAIPTTVPRMAYVFQSTFRLPDTEIAPLQSRHADMCEALGPNQCMIVGMEVSGNEDTAAGRLELAVAASRARAFVGELADLVPAYRGDQVAAQITGEDLSKNMVDTEAHLRTRIALRDRLQEVLRNRRGSVEELVEAERQVASINEEIDAARSWMGEMRGRVQMARVVLSYESATPAGSRFIGPVAAAFGSLGGILGYIAAALILMAGIVGPFVAGALALRWLQRRRLVGDTDG